MDSAAAIFESIVADPAKKWVLFEHGTCVILENPGGDLAEQAIDILRKQDAAHGGTASGDFSVMKLELHPGWLVGFSNPAIYTYVGLEDMATQNPSEIGIGIVARANYNADVAGLQVVYVKT